jgi:glycosyltransferase involved in cell wall biosynthesis
MLMRSMTGTVLFASYSGLLGGAERVLLDCATRLPRPAVIACPRGELARAARAAGLRHAEIHGGGLPVRPAQAAALARMTWEVAGLRHRLRAAALVAWSSRAVLALAPLRPEVAVLHDIHHGALRTAVHAAAGRARVLVAASRAVAADAVILHPGVDLAAFSPTPLPDGAPSALFLGALVPWKRPDLALEIARRMPELQLTIAGEPLPGETMALAPPGNVTLAGRVDARQALAQTHVLLHCADEEPFGLALVEALACGRPVVAPAAAGPREIVADGGRLYPPGDAGAAVAALRAVLGDAELPAKARRRAEDFDVEASAARFAAAVEAAL